MDKQNLSKIIKELITLRGELGLKISDDALFIQSCTYDRGNSMQEVKDKKESTGRDGIRNLLLSGNMAQDLDPVKKQDFVYVLKWKSATERKKALGNYEHAPNMMQPVSDSIDSELQKLAFKLYKEEKK
jgi:hypothetical protein